MRLLYENERGPTVFKIICVRFRYSDMRIPMAVDIQSMWQSLGKSSIHDCLSYHSWSHHELTSSSLPRFSEKLTN